MNIIPINIAIFRKPWIINERHSIDVGVYNECNKFGAINQSVVCTVGAYFHGANNGFGHVGNHIRK